MELLTFINDAFNASLPGSYLALVVMVAVFSQWLAWQWKVPSILILLVVGFGLGQWKTADEILGRDVLFAGVSLTVGIILFEGSLGLKSEQIRELGLSIRRLLSITVLIAWALIGASAWLVGFNWKLAVLIGALLVVTGPTVINPILRQLRPTRRVSSLLRWEGIVVDPIGAVIATLVFQAVVARGDNAAVAVVTGLTNTLALGFGMGIGVGWLIREAMVRRLVPDFLQGVMFLGSALFVFAISNAVQPESGLLTVTVLGVYLANQHGLNLHRVREFKEHLQVLLVGSLFILLAGRISIEELVAVAPRALFFLVLLVLVARPLSIYLPLLGTETSMRERTLLAFMAPRGIVAAAVTSIFALEFHHTAEDRLERAANSTGAMAEQLRLQAAELTELSKQADALVPTVFIVIVGTVAIYGLGVGRLAERLGLASTAPQGVLFAGASPWVVQASEHLKALKIPTLLVSRDFTGVRRARMAEVNVEHTNILSEYAVEEMDISGLGSFIATLPDDTTNSSAAREFAAHFGSANTFQIGLAERAAPTAERRLAAEHLAARVAFKPALTHEQLEEKMKSGMVVRRTKLSKEFTREDFFEKYGDNVVLMFIHREGKLTVMTEDTSVPEMDATIIAMLPSREDDPELIHRKVEKKKVKAQKVAKAVAREHHDEPAI